MGRGVLLGLIGLVLWSAAPAGSRAEEPLYEATESTVTSTPEVETTEGLIAELDLSSPEPTLKLATEDGTVWSLELDPKTTSVWQNGQMIELTQLHRGQLVKVRHVLEDGIEVVRSIVLVQMESSRAAQGESGARRPAWRLFGKQKTPPPDTAGQ